ncbi:MAG TPA: hypothetical protein VN743_03535, partial [Blastocatellia bacterium]|nr:hypothetical protein [Blastocatellia bacterium]
MSIDANKPFNSETFEQLLRGSELAHLASEVSSGRRVVVLSGLAGSARALILNAIEKQLGRRVVFVARSNREVEEIQPDVDFFYCALNGGSPSDQSVLTIPAVEADPYDGTSPHVEVLEQRTLALHRATRGEARILLTSIGALAERTVSPDLLKASSITLRPTEEMPPELIVDL